MPFLDTIKSCFSKPLTSKPIKDLFNNFLAAFLNVVFLQTQVVNMSGTTEDTLLVDPVRMDVLGWLGILKRVVVNVSSL